MAGRTGAPAHRHTALAGVVLGLVEKVARALHAAHEAHLVHRDVKPGNIIMSKEGEPILLDFGLAGDLSDAHLSMSTTGDRMGTPAYMAPEQVRGERVDRRADIWALGVILYEALSGKRPFAGANSGEIDRAILRSSPRSLRRLSPRLSMDVEAVVDAALEKLARLRYGDAATLADDLRALRERRPVGVRRTGALLRLARWSAREPARASALVLAVLLLAVGGFFGPQWMTWQADRAQLSARRAEERAETLANRGFIKVSGGNLTGAVLDFEDALSKNSDRADVRLGIMICFRAVKNWSKVAEVLSSPELQLTLDQSPYLRGLLDAARRTRNGHSLGEVSLPDPRSAIGWLIRGYGAWNEAIIDEEDHLFEEAAACYAAAIRDPRSGGPSLPVLRRPSSRS